MATKIKWGIIGLGNIADKFAQDLNLHSESILYGVASRDITKANIFKSKHNAYTAFDSYEKLAKCKDIDVIYIATPHVFHYENTMLCLNEGKAVLCEKPFSMNAIQSKKMIDLAKSKNVFLMEAIWTVLMPSTDKLLELIDNNIIGKIKSIDANFGFDAIPRKVERLFSNKLGGGSLLDIGIYPILLCQLVLGVPNKIEAKANIDENNVDIEFEGKLFYNDVKIANVKSSLLEKTSTEAIIVGTKGSIRMTAPFHHTKKIILSVDGKDDIIFDFNTNVLGYYYEIEETVKCIKNGETQSERLPLSFTLNLTETLDKIRKIIGLKYESD